MGNPRRWKNYFDEEAEEGGIAAFVQLGKWDSCLPVQAEAKSPQVEQLCTNLQVMGL